MDDSTSVLNDNLDLERIARLQELAASAEPSELMQWTRRLKTGAMISIAVLVLTVVELLAALHPFAMFVTSIGSLIAGWILISPEPNAPRFSKWIVWAARAGLCVGFALTEIKTVEALAGNLALNYERLATTVTMVGICLFAWQLRRFGAMLGDAVVRRTYNFIFWVILITLPFDILWAILTPASNIAETAAPAELLPLRFAFLAISLAFVAFFVWVYLRLWRRADELEKLAARAA